MTPGLFARRVSVAVGWRLAIGLLPSLLAAGLVVGLFYYGEFGRAAPTFILVAAAALSVISLGITWINARYFIDRIGRLARVGANAAGRGPGEDEFERIEQVVGTLGSALSEAEAKRAQVSAEASAQRQDEATMLAGVVADTRAQLDQVRMPLHILLEAPFGELNENQEELLRDARAAADAMDAALRRLGQIADADRGAMAVQPELVQVNDVVRSILPLARAAAERSGGRVETSLEPGLPRVLTDRARLAEALSVLTTDVAEVLDGRRPMHIETRRDGRGALITLSPAPASLSVFARKLIEAQRGTITHTTDALELRVGLEPPPS